MMAVLGRIENFSYAVASVQVVYLVEAPSCSLAARINVQLVGVEKPHRKRSGLSRIVLHQARHPLGHKRVVRA